MAYEAYYYYDLIIIVLGVASILVTLIAQVNISAAYGRYRLIKGSKNLTGKDVARKILDANGLDKIAINVVGGELTDYYNPSNKSISLSRDIYDGDSVASIAVAAHECGHAIQDKVNYGPMRFRAALVPIVNFVDYTGYFVIIIGAIFGIMDIIRYAICAMFIGLIFQLVTLPVEYDASNRALKQMKKLELVESDEEEDAKNMLHAAALTYVASLASTLLQLLRLGLIARERDRN